MMTFHKLICAYVATKNLNKNTVDSSLGISKENNTFMLFLLALEICAV